MLIHCPACEAKVDAKEISRFDYTDDVTGLDATPIFMQCPSCKGPLLGLLEFDNFGSPKNEITHYRLLSPTRPSKLGIS